MNIVSERTYESNVRIYSRHFPDTFAKARGSHLIAEDGRAFIDFFAGAGALNYGHHNDYIIKRVVEYLENGGLIHALDMLTSAKSEFLKRFASDVLGPRNMDYKIQFCGPTGTDAVEAALKLARKVTGRRGVIAFTGSYHGVSLGSLAVTSSRAKRAVAGTHLGDVTFVPFPEFVVQLDTLVYLNTILADPRSGVDVPAAIIVETIQAEGGVNVAPVPWLEGIREICDKYQILLICDEIQVGCWRTGTFFSFERAGIRPDLIVLSKSLSGYGAPMSVVLLRPDIDLWEPGEHTGTFRGYQLAYVGATAALEYVKTTDLPAHVTECGRRIREVVESEILTFDSNLVLRGMGMIWGIDFSKCSRGSLAAMQVARECYANGLIVECAGRSESVLKLLPPLTISAEVLDRGLAIVCSAVRSCLKSVAVAAG